MPQAPTGVALGRHPEFSPASACQPRAGKPWGADRVSMRRRELRLRATAASGLSFQIAFDTNVPLLVMFQNLNFNKVFGPKFELVYPQKPRRQRQATYGGLFKPLSHTRRRRAVRG